MKEQIKNLIKHSGIYGAGVVLSRSIGFFLIPLYTRYLSPADYGVLELLDLTVSLTMLFTSMGVFAAVFRFYAMYESPEEKKEVISTALLFNASVALLMALGMNLVASPLASAVLGDSSYAPLIRVVAFTLFFSNIAGVPEAYWRAQGRTVLFVTVGLVRAILTACLLVLAVAVLKKGVEGVVVANLVASAVSGLTLSGIVLYDVRIRIAKAKLIAMLRYGVPLIAESLAAFILAYSDRFFLRKFASLSEVGIYSLGYKLAGIVSILVAIPFGQSWSWQQFELAKREDATALFAKVETYLLMGGLCVALAVSVLAPDLLRIISPIEYWRAASIVPWIALSYLLGIISYMASTGIYIRRETTRIAAIAICTAGVNLALNFLLIPRYGSTGAAIATALSYALNLFLTVVAAQRIYPIPFEYLRNARLVGSAGAICLLGTQINLGLAGSAAAHSLLVVLFVAVCYAVLSRGERKAIREWALKAAQQFQR
jgi:O-antigen/teichoic acid export membrane protein